MWFSISILGMQYLSTTSIHQSPALTNKYQHSVQQWLIRKNFEGELESPKIDEVK